MRIWDHRYTRDLRRYELAWRFIGHEARTDTIAHFTGLTHNRIRTLCRAYAAQGVNKAHRHRGSAPYLVDYFLSSPQRQAEAAAIGSWCALIGLISKDIVQDPGQPIPGLQRGEDLCSTYELYRAMLPQPQRSQFSIEHFILLMTALARGEEVRLKACDRCGGALVVEQSVIVQGLCVFCRRQRSTSSDTLAIHEAESGAAADASVQEPHTDPAGVQQSLF